MTGFMKILVPTDFSDTSRDALKYVLSWFKDVSVEHEVVLLNTYLVPPVPADQLVRMNDELRENSRKKLEAERDVIQQGAGSDVRFQLLSHLGTLGNVVGYLSAKEKVDGLVVGVAEDLDFLLQSAHCPVLIVPPRSAYVPIQNVGLVREKRGNWKEDFYAPWRKAFAPSVVTHVLAKPVGAKWIENALDFALKNRIDLIIWQGDPASFPSTLKNVVGGLGVPLTVPILFLGEGRTAL